MPITDDSYRGFLTLLGEKQVTKQKYNVDLPVNPDGHSMLLTQIALQRDAFVGSRQIDSFMADILGDDWKQMTGNKEGELSYLSVRPSVAASVMRGVLLNRGVSMTQAVSGNIDPEIKRQISIDFAEACNDPVKMGKLVAEAVKGAASFNINLEMAEALGDKSLMPGDIGTAMGTDTGRVLTAVYLTGFRNMAQELKQFGDHVMHASTEGYIFSKEDVHGSISPMGDAFLDAVSDEDLAAYWRMTHLADSLGANKSNPEMLIGYYTSRFFDPNLAEYSIINGYDAASVSPEVNAQRAMIGAMVAQDIGERMSLAGRAGSLGYPGRDFLVQPLNMLAGRYGSNTEVNAVLSDPLAGRRLMNELLNTPDRAERELASAHINMDVHPQYSLYVGEKGLKTAYSSYTSEIPGADRLDAEVGKKMPTQVHPFELGGFSDEERRMYATERKGWSDKLAEESRKLDAQIAAATDDARKAELRAIKERFDARAARMGREAEMAANLEKLDKPSFDTDSLLEEPEIRPELKAKIIEAGRIRSLVGDELQDICRKEGNGQTFREFFESDDRDMTQVCVVPDSITDDEARRDFVRNWVRDWKDVPAGRKKCLDAFFDAQDRLAVKDYDLSCLTASDDSAVMDDGLTKSEHDFIDMLFLRAASQARATKGFVENPAYFNARYGGNAAEMFRSLRGRYMDGIDVYLQQVMQLNGLMPESMRAKEAGDFTSGISKATMRSVQIAEQRFRREYAAIYGKEIPDVSKQTLIMNNDLVAKIPGLPDDGALETEKADLVSLVDRFSRGEPLTAAEELDIQGIFNANIGTALGFSLVEYDKKRADFGVDFYDTLFIDGKSVREYVGNKYGDPKGMTDAELTELNGRYLVEVTMAALSGEHRVEAAEILKDKDGKSMVNLVSVQIDCHALDAAENKAHHNAGRRAFNFGLTKIQTRADKADRLWADDPDRETRKTLAVAALYQKAERNKAAAALRTEWESSKTAVTAQSQAQKAQETAAKTAHEAAITAAGRSSFKPLTTEEYEKAMTDEFNSLTTAREKAQMLLGVAVAKASGSMNPAEEKAANNFLVLGLLDRQPNAAINPNGTRDIFREFVRLQTESAVSLSAVYSEKLAAYGPAAGAEAKAMLDVMGMPETFVNSVLDTFNPEDVLTLIDPSKLSGEAASRYQLMVTYNQVFPEGFRTATSQVYQQERQRAEAAMDDTQKRIGQRMTDALDEAKLTAAGLTEEHLDAALASAQGIVAGGVSQYTSYRLRASEQIGIDAESIYDVATMSEFLTEVSKLPGIKDDRWFAAEMTNISTILKQLNGEKVVPDDFREHISDLMMDVNEVFAAMSPEERTKAREAYAEFREHSKLQEKINTQPLNTAMGRLQDTADVIAMDQLFYRMNAEDMADPKHKNSPEYTAMYQAVKAVHEAAATFDPADRDSRARMAELMQTVREASSVYAEAEAYKKKNGEIGIARKNSALMALSISSGGEEPDLKRIKDLRLDRRGKKASDPQTMLQRLFADAKAKYGVTAQTARDSKVVATSVERQNAATARENRERISAHKREKRHELQAIRDRYGIKNFRINNPVYFGLDASLFAETGLRSDAVLPADATPEQRDIFEKLKSLQESKASTDGMGAMAGTEISRGGFGGTKNLALLSFINDQQEKGQPVSLADALDPTKFTEEKRAWGAKVVSALVKARGDQPDTKDLAAIIGTAMKTLNAIDVKAETLKFLGAPPDLPADQAAALMADRKNFAKVSAILQAQGDMAVGAYQVMQSSGITSSVIYWDKIDFSKKDPVTGALTPEAFSGAIGSQTPNPELMAFMNQVVEAAGETEIAKFYYTKNATKSLAKARGIGEYVSGSKRQFSTLSTDDTQEMEALKAVMGFGELISTVSGSTSMSDPAMYGRRMQVLEVNSRAVGQMVAGGKRLDIDQLIYDGLNADQAARFDANFQAIVNEWAAKNPGVVKDEADAADRLHKAQEREAEKAAAPKTAAPAAPQPAPAPVPEAPAPEAATPPAAHEPEPVPAAAAEPEAPSMEGVEFLSKITGVPAADLENYETFYHALDTVYVNGLSATEYFKETAPELHIDDDYDPLAIGAQEAVGKKLKAFIDAAKVDSFSAVFVAVEDENGLLKTVEASAEGLDAQSAANIESYNRIADRMYTDMNKVRLEALEGKRKQAESAAAGPDAPKMTADEQARQTTMETAVSVSEGKHRRVAGGLSGLMKMDQKITKDKPDYAALASARRQAQNQQGGPSKNTQQRHN